ncbi:dienelactone hydrolase family protein [Niveomyces insectorum RCEF 264]|uniref:Dienelactone hydrolase family protein n=1 Tax=Niveomyces insectorum RCEF 264 TaxID=1081102 RepID=A0A167WCA3_9HYPO|nr:dienelactone hydrolase family protein [Niveomyces insectorum RCEF 264]
MSSTMPATHGHSEACCNVPPVVSQGYKVKGTYETYAGKKTYTVGPDDATKGIVVVFDIFGYKDQTLQGADILATSDNENKYKVFMPDWFDGAPLPLEYHPSFPPNTPEKQEALKTFFGKHSPPSVSAKLLAYTQALKQQFPSIKTWGVLGYCWGGKVVVLTLANDANPFAAGVEAHPAMVDPNDATGLKVPVALLASKDETPADVAAFEKNLTVPHHVETFGDQIHGWMAARSDLADPRVKAEYVRGYETALSFFGTHLT